MSTTEADELFDVLTQNGAVTGQTKPRALVHQDGDWHRSFHLWIIKDGRFVLLQRRSRNKDLEAGKVDVTVGGHFRAGESLEHVVREVEEEIGLFVRPKDLHFLETRKAERHYPQAIDREFQEIYVYCCDQPLQDYYLNPAEVDVLYEVPLEAAIALHRDGQYVAASGFDAQQRNNNALLIKADLIEQARADVVETLLLIKAWLDHKG
jgi:isopentenyldiphosphate isomerase